MWGSHGACLVVFSVFFAMTVEVLDADVSYLAALRKQTSRNFNAPANYPMSRSSSAVYPSLARTTSKRDGGCVNKYNFDYLTLTLQWGPGFCATSPESCKKMERRFFTIHGMWPSYRSKESLDFCCFDNSFVYKEIEQIAPTLNKYWISYYDQDNRGFWKHEWLKHGTCARDVKELQGELAYFSTTLNLMSQLPVLDTLRKDNIVPNNQKVYNSINVVNTLRQLSGGKNVKLNCDYEHDQPTPVFTGLSFCFDRNLKFTDCPPSNVYCRRQILFLA